MKKFYFPLLIGVTFLLVGFGYKPQPLEGNYAVKLRSLTFFDLVSKDVDLGANLAELSDNKPEIIKVDPECTKLKELQYGHFKFGNNQQKTWFVMGQDSGGYWTEFYIDQNNDQRISVKEKIKAFQTTDGRYRGFKTKQSFGLIPASISVSYKGQRNSFTKQVYFFFSLINILGKNNTDTIAEAMTASFLEGEFRTLKGKEEKPVRFRIIDTAGDGCYDDFGKDLLYLDLNNDGYFKKNESQKLTEFFRNAGKQCRMVVLPMPVKILVTTSEKELNLSQLESSSESTE